MFLQIGERQQSKFALFNLGFRPFFLLSVYAGAILIALWALMYANLIQLSNYYGFIHWHSHEMLFAYTGAVIAGFLLTAVRNWTNVDTITHTPLALLAGLWVIGRLLPFTGVSGWIMAMVDLSFFILLMLVIAKPVLQARQVHNLIMPAIVLGLALANLLVHLQHLAILKNGVFYGNNLAIYAILLLLTIVTGRVMPFFTRMAVPGYQLEPKPWLEKSMMGLLFLYSLTDTFSLDSRFNFVLAAVLTGLHSYRLFRWFTPGILRIPILWVLYAGYIWIIIGFALKCFVHLGYVGNNLSIHAWTVGVIGMITYGMMARVSLGHTGREMKAPKPAVVGFVLLFTAAIVRVVLPIFYLKYYLLWVGLSAGLWTVAFILLAVAYSKMLVIPRVDGKPG